jgi:O-antigen/teichoic acid export membrane protein
VLALTRPAGQLRSVGWVALCVVGSGVLTYFYLALVARALPVVDYSYFGAFWSLALVIAFGAFLPVELELARLLQSRPAGARLPAGALPSLAGLSVGAALVVVATAGTLVPALGGHTSFLVALVVLCGVAAGQFLLRGIMLGRGRLGLHGGVLLLDSGLRVALAAAVAIAAPGAHSTTFAWTLVAAVALAHLPLLAVVLLRHRKTRQNAPPLPAPDAGRGPFVSAVGHLLVGSLCAQALLNAAPVLATGLATRGQAVEAAQFVASYTLVRLPLFVAVPLQSALIPFLTRVSAQEGGAGARRLVLRGLAGVMALTALAAVVGLLAGPGVVRLVFGPRYALPGADIALLAAGSVLHLGLLVASQTLVASARSRSVAAVWLIGLAAATAAFLLVPSLALRCAAGFTVGSAAGLGVAAGLLRAGKPATPRPGARRSTAVEEGSTT